MPNDRINWYPGHMARSRRLLQDQLRAVDAVIELCDARAPLATRNPDLQKLTRDKTRILVLNKADLADDNQTARWLEYFRGQGLTAMRFNSNGGKVKEILPGACARRSASWSSASPTWASPPSSTGCTARPS